MLTVIEIKKTDFGIKNIALVSAVAVVLVSLAWMQSPIRALNANKVTALNTPDPAPPDYNQVAAEVNANTVSQSSIADTQSKGGTLSSDLLGAAGTTTVLGASSVNPILLAPYQHEKVLVIQNSSTEAMTTYAEQISVIQKNDNASNLLIEGANTSYRTLDVEARQMKFIQDLRSIAVPADLVEYHSLLVNFYTLKFAEASSPNGVQISSTALPAITARIQELQLSAKRKFGIYLPGITAQ